MATKKAKDMKARLRRLIDESGGQAEFCRRVWPSGADANKAKVSKWYSPASSGISSDEVEAVAKACSYRPAWLLWGELPERSGVTRTDAELADDLAAYVAAKALEKVNLAEDPALAAKLKELIQREGKTLLRIVVDLTADEARANADAWRDYRKSVVTDLLNVSDALYGPTLDRDRAMRYAQRLADALRVPQGKVIRWPSGWASIHLAERPTAPQAKAGKQPRDNSNKRGKK